MSYKKILKETNDYYTSKIRKFGNTPKGVDWNSIESQELRFKQLIKIFNKIDNNFSLLDYGCGFGSLLEFLTKNNLNVKYTGFDISTEMTNKAAQTYTHHTSTWINKLDNKTYDYLIASGIFNVKQNNSNKYWLKYILSVLNNFDKIVTKGFSFNILTKYSDREYMKDYLYYADPCYIFDYCKQNFSKNVALLHDYGLYEFSILVKK